MKIYLAISLIGPFALNEEGTIIDVRYFNPTPTQVAEKISQLEQGELPTELEAMLKEHAEDELAVQDPELGRILSSHGFKVFGDYQHAVIDRFYQNITQHVITAGLFLKEQEYLQFIRETVLLITRERVRQAAEKRDRLIVHAIETIDDLDKTVNLFANRLREFYGMHFPELGDAIDNHHTFALIISATGEKEAITKSLLVDELKLPEAKATKILEAREKSMGSSLLEKDIQIIRDQAKTVVDLYARRHQLEKWMESTMAEVAPNLAGVVNPLLAARLIALAGGLRELAVSPSSKIQVLGAEKALYRTMRTGAPPPKHGIIFQDPRLNQSKWWQRGKIARAIAAKLSIASRMDFFDAEDKSAKLREELNEKIEEIKTKYPNPPERRRKSSRQRRSKKRNSRSSRRR
ncbi:MAG: C/D box methylation guide ribonucleoprotein complex aNOP56 subunit [Candidatus Heimdallarchaeota archaeon]|nr:C/D box methylation guide ribonucleoprotein complex aNOP56 subunit [Candidatus Heimdallarchaeota archaeon]